jgi:hypothetical protein
MSDVQVKGTRSVVEAALSSIRSQISSEGPTVLQRSLCNAVLSDANAGCKVTVTLSELLSTQNGTDEEALESTESNFYIIMVIVFATMSLSSILLFFMCHLTRFKSRLNKAQTWEDPVIRLPTKDVDAGPETVVDANNTFPKEISEKPKNDEEISLAGSTATPASSTPDACRDLEAVSVGEGDAVVSGIVSTTTEDMSPEIV